MKILISWKQYQDLDKEVEEETKKLGLEVLNGRERRGEIPTSIAGKIGDFVFERQRGHWWVKGDLSIEIANSLHKSQLGNNFKFTPQDATPDKVAKWKTKEGGKVVLSAEKRKLIEGICKNAEELFIFSNNPSEIATQVVDNFQIHSEEAVGLFIETLKKHNLA
ncbi:MAG: hypothetical protein WCO84_03055 [bacterium]